MIAVHSSLQGGGIGTKVIQHLEKQLVNERRTNSYKEWMRLQTMKKKQTRQYRKRQEQNKEEIMARQMAKQEEMQQEMRQRRDDETEYYNNMASHGMDMDEEDMDGYSQY